MAIASAIASAAAFAVGGRMKRALGFVSAIALTMALFAAVAYTCLWLAPWLARSDG